MWMIVAAGIVLMIVVVAARRRFADDSDLGSVTERWLMEHRAAHADSR